MKSIENDFIYSGQGYVGHHGCHRHQGHGGVHQKVYIYLFGMCPSLIHFFFECKLLHIYFLLKFLFVQCAIYKSVW